MSRRNGWGRWCAAMRCSACSASTNGTRRTGHSRPARCFTRSDSSRANPERAWGLWHRAFAWALVGRHGDALADLAAAKEKAPAKDPPETPAWVELVDAFARYDSGRLAQKEGPKAKLAALLCMLTLTFPRNTAIGLQSAKDVVSLQPDCFLAHDAMSDFRGVSTQHMTTMIAPQALQGLVFNTLRTLDGIPGSVKDQLDENSSILQAADLFDKAARPRAIRVSLLLVPSDA